MFGPNTYIKHNSVISYSHRDKEFINIYERVSDKFSEKFNLEDYDILFIPGSGTIGMESIFYSNNSSINVIGNEGVFKKKWQSFSDLYKKNTHSSIDLFCSLETSNSTIFKKENSIVDAISSFPYYSIPKDTKIIATCSNKQLGGFPGLAIVAVKKDYWSYLKSPEEFSYLNLSRYLDFSKKNQTPSTAPTQIFEHFETVLDHFKLSKLKSKINTNSEKIIESIGLENIIGEAQCPVITIKKEFIPIDIAKKFQLYGVNTNGSNYQIFTYSCDDRDYDLFCKELSR